MLRSRFIYAILASLAVIALGALYQMMQPEAPPPSATAVSVPLSETVSEVSGAASDPAAETAVDPAAPAPEAPTTP